MRRCAASRHRSAFNSVLFRSQANVYLVPGSGAFQLVSRVLNVVSSSGTAANATSSNYNNLLQLTGTTGSVWIDISTLTAAQKASMCLYWYNEVGTDTTTLYYDLANATYIGGAQVNLPTAYTIKGSTQAGGGSSVPSSGITTLATVASNGLQSRKHSFVATGYNWIGMDITSSSGSNIQLKLDLYDASAGARDLIHIGDSRVWYGLRHSDPHGGTVSCDSFGNLMQPAAGFYMPTICAGMSGAVAGQIGPLISGWMSASSGIKYATVNLGVNDANTGPYTSAFATDYQAVVNALISAGCTKVFCESIGYSSDSTINSRLPTYNSAIATIVSGTSKCFTGFDEYQFYVDTPSYISGDGLHGTDAGFAALRTAKAAYYASRV
jgi:hypothetical protein